MPKKFLEAGKIVGTHGVRGDLKVQSWCDSPEVLCDFDTLYLDEKTPVTVEKAQVHKNVVLMHIKGIDTVEAAEAMRNKVLHLDREDVELPEVALSTFCRPCVSLLMRESDGVTVSP